MAAYIVAHLEILDNEAYADYRQRVQGMIEAFGGKMLGRGDVVDVIGGEMPPGHHRIIIMEFPTLEQAREYQTLPPNHPEYAEIRALRDRTSNPVLFVVSGD